MTQVSPPWFFLDSLKQCLEIHRTESVAFPRPTGTRKRKTTPKKKHSIPRTPSVRGFTALCNGSVALNRPHVFSTVCTGFMFFPRSTPVLCFSRAIRAWRALHLSYVFPALYHGSKFYAFETGKWYITRDLLPLTGSENSCSLGLERRQSLYAENVSEKDNFLANTYPALRIRYYGLLLFLTRSCHSFKEYFSHLVINSKSTHQRENVKERTEESVGYLFVVRAVQWSCLVFIASFQWSAFLQ